MRGFSEAVLFIFLFTALVMAFYIGVESISSTNADMMQLLKSSLDDALKKEYITYRSIGECNTGTNTLKIFYTGNIPEYYVRTFCVDYYDYNTLCEMQLVGGGTVTTMVEKLVMNTVLYDLNTCGATLVNACANGTLICYAVGRYDVVPITFS